MVRLRAAKVAKVVEVIPDVRVFGPETGELLVVSWGGTFGAVRTAVEQARSRKLPVAHLHLRHLNPMPRNLGDILKRFPKILVPELNLGQLLLLLRARYLVDARGASKVQGRPFRVAELLEHIEQMLKGEGP
jgi:2-oxoglutarate ferredoxin oxidoreductase subunit alpha